MNELQVFENVEFGKVRTVVIDNEPWLVGKDVAEILGYKNQRDALAKHVDDDDKGVAKCDTLGGKQDLTIINESGMYALVFGSKLPSAKRFKHWVTSEVLPTIRKTGGYNIKDSYMIDDPVERAKRWIEEETTRQEQAKQLEEQRPMVVFANAVSASDTSILMGGLAKLICQNGVNIGQKWLFQWMRENGWLIKSGTEKNMPTQKAMNMKLFEVKEGSYVDGQGVNRITRTTKVTGKGQVYFVNKFLSMN